MEGFPNVDEVAKDMESKMGGEPVAETKEPSGDDSSNQPENTEGAEQKEEAQKAAAAEAIIELTQGKKIKIDGREFTPEELKKSLLLHGDYTKKTQMLAEQRKKFEEEQKYISNLRADLLKVRDNPDLIEEFKKVYPEQYHHYLDVVYGAQKAPEAKTDMLPPEVQHELKTLREEIRAVSQSERARKEAEYNAEVSKNQAFLEKEFGKNSKQFPFAHQDTVLARLQTMQSEGVEITSEVINKAFKSVHDSYNELFTKHYHETVKKQQSANSKGKDMGAGGATPGQAPNVNKTFKEAQAAMVKALSG